MERLRPRPQIKIPTGLSGETLRADEHLELKRRSRTPLHEHAPHAQLLAEALAIDWYTKTKVPHLSGMPPIADLWPQVTARMLLQGPSTLPESTSTNCPGTGATY